MTAPREPRTPEEAMAAALHISGGTFPCPAISEPHVANANRHMEDAGRILAAAQGWRLVRVGWEAAMEDPAFRASLDAGLADVAAGRLVSGDRREPDAIMVAAFRARLDACRELPALAPLEYLATDLLAALDQAVSGDRPDTGVRERVPRGLGPLLARILDDYDDLRSAGLATPETALAFDAHRGQLFDWVDALTPVIEGTGESGAGGAG